MGWVDDCVGFEYIIQILWLNLLQIVKRAIHINLYSIRDGFRKRQERLLAIYLVLILYEPSVNVKYFQP